MTVQDTTPAMADEEYIETLETISKAMWVYLSPLLVIVGTVGNILSIVTLLSKGFLQTSTRVVFCVLALADLSVLYIGLLDHWARARWGFNIRLVSNTACRVHLFAAYYSVHLSAWTLALLTAERLVSVTWPLRAHLICTSRRMAVVVMLVALFLVGFDGFLLVKGGIRHETPLHGPKDLCTVDPRVEDFLMWSDLMVSCVLPCVFLFFSNGFIIYKLSEARETHRDSIRAHQGAATANSVTVMLVAVSGFFLVTSLPINIHLLASASWVTADDPKDMAEYRLVFTVVTLVYYLNNSANFLFYFAAGRKFRQAFIGWFCCSRKSASENLSPADTGRSTGRLTRVEKQSLRRNTSSQRKQCAIVGINTNPKITIISQ